MPIWLWILIIWILFAVPAAIIFGKSIQLADRRKGWEMVRYPESRFTRRLKARQEARAEQERKELLGEATPKHPLGDPRIGNDRRQAERRSITMTPNEVDDWLKRNGISTGDRRHNDRRSGDRRR